MASTGTYAFQPDIAELFDEAFERAGIAPQGVGASHIRSALRSMKFMLNSEWSTLGVRQWQIHQGTQTLTAGMASFTLPAGAIDMLQGVLRRGGNDTELYPISRSDYLTLTDKDLRGRPDRFFVDRQASGPTVYLWPCGENGTDVLVYDYFRQMQDVGQMSNTLNMPSHAWEACAAGLAYNLALKFNVDRVNGLRQAYGGTGYPAVINGGALERMRQEDRERGDIQLYPAFEPRMARR